jgi:hypothetical protein
MLEKTINILKYLLIVSTPLMMLSGCGSWKMQDSINAPKQQVSTDQIAIIERMKGRTSPSIKTFDHIDLGFSGYTSGSRWNTLFSPNRVETPPGRVQIGVVDPAVAFVRSALYYPDVTFVAKPGHKYGLTWLCIPYSFVAVVDMESLCIVAVDSFYPGGENIIGKKLLQSSECSNTFRAPPWMKPDEKHYWLPWLGQKMGQKYKNLCYAAEHDVATAQYYMGNHYYSGTFGVEKNEVMAYVWYRKALASNNKKNSLESKALKNVRIMVKHFENTFSTKQREEAKRLLRSSKLKACETIRPFISGENVESWKPKYKIKY